MKQSCITILLAMLISMVGATAYGQSQRTIHVATAGTLSTLISEEEKYQIEELTLSGELNGDDIFLIREMAGINMDNMDDFNYLGKLCITDGKLRVLDLSDARIVEGGRDYYRTKMGSYSFSGYTYTANDEISACMFTYCHKLEELILPKSAKVISPRMMSGYASDKPDMNLKILRVADGNPKYDSRDNCNAIIATNSNQLIFGFNNSVIPNSVTSIGDYAFENCSDLENIIIPEGVTIILSYAFYGCSSLTSIALPNTLKSIEGSAFAYCSSLNSITIPNSVTYIGDYSFAGSGLTSITIPNSVTQIERWAFSGCNFKSVTVDISEPLVIEENVFSNFDATLYVPKGCKAAYESANYWKDFKSIEEDENLKGTVHKVGDTFTADGVLYQVTSVDPLEVQVGNGDTSFGSVAIEKSIEGAFEIPATVTGADENVYSVTAISKSAFSGCSGMTSVTIPSSVVTIAGGFDFGGSAFVGGAFENCGLTTLTIPSSVTSIGGGAFAGCSNLVSIVVEDGNTVYDSRNNCNAIIEKENNRLIAGCKNTIIPDGVISISTGAFFGCKGLTSMDIPNSVTYISDYVFMNCNELTSLNISENVTSIGTHAFAYCSGLTSITIPESVKTIWHDAFYGCSGLVSASILSKSMNLFGLHTYSGRYVGLFGKCDKLTTVIVGNEEPFDIGGSFLDDSANAILYVPKGSVEAYAAADYWKDFKEIKEFVEDESATYIIEEDKTVTIKDVLDSTEKEVEIPQSVTIEGEEYAVTAIAESAFEGNTTLEQVTIPATITSIGDGAFSGCTSLKAIYCYSEEPAALGSAKAMVRTRANGEETLASTVFAEVDKETCILYVPKNSGDKYRDADGWGEFKNIVEMDSEIPGDANNDGYVDQKDIDAIVSYIMTGNEDGFIFKNADMNGDKEVNAADIVLIVNMIK